MSGNKDNAIKKYYHKCVYSVICSSFSPSVCQLDNFCSPRKFCILVSGRESTNGNLQLRLMLGCIKLLKQHHNRFILIKKSFSR